MRGNVHVSDIEEDSYSSINTLHIGSVTNDSRRLMINVDIKNYDVRMELDTGEQASLASASVWEQIGRPRLDPAPRLCSYGGVEVPTIGQCTVDVAYNQKSLQLLLVFAVSRDSTSLFGLPWINAFDVIHVNSTSSDFGLNSLLAEFADLFDETTL